MYCERLMISQTPSIGGISNQLMWEKECGGNSPSFWCEFCKTLPTQNRIFQTFQNCGILDLLQFCICQYDKYKSKKSYTVLFMGVEVIICQSEMSPERLMIFQTPSIGGTSDQLRWEKEYGGNSPSFCCTFCKTLPTQNRIFQTFQNSPIVCSVLALDSWNYCSGEQAQQPNICKIPQSSLYSWTIVHKTKIRCCHLM